MPNSVSRFLNLMLSPRGRTGRGVFALSLLVFALYWAVQHFVLGALGTGALNFYIAPIFFFLGLHIMFCIYGKRLHDLGRSTWPLIGMFAIVILAAIFAMLNYGGLEYFDTLYDNPTMADDAAAMEAHHAHYRETLSQNMGKINLITGGIFGGFTLALLLWPSQPGTNRYG